VRADERSFVDSAVILPHVDVGRGCTIKRAIVDEGCQIPDGMSIGTDLALDGQRFHLTENAVVLVTADMLRQLNSP
jgi:glucose-1-phosphate adenylyltransferase